MGRDLASLLASNVRMLRMATGRTQKEMAKLAGVPRATWANVESGTANPTLAVLHSVADALRVPLEALIAKPAASVSHRPRAELTVSKRGRATVLGLLAGAADFEFERMAIPPGAHTDSAVLPKSFLECFAVEAGTVEVSAGAYRARADAGDVLITQGGQRRAYANVGSVGAVGYVVLIRS